MINKTRKLSTKIYSAVNYFSEIQSLKQTLSQKHCYLCEVSICSNTPICKSCRHDLPFNHTYCQRCAIPLPPSTSSSQKNRLQDLSLERMCGECLKSPPSYNECFSAFSYTFPINALISDFKYSQKRHLGKLMSTLMSQQVQARIEQDILTLPDKLIPVPLHPDKLGARGFNQASDICRDLSHTLNIPIDTTSVERVLNNPAQASLSKLKRQQNLAKAFQVRHNLKGEVVTLVDDVITTGVTAELLSKLFLQAGAKEVYVWSLARTPLKN